MINFTRDSIREMIDKNKREREQKKKLILKKTNTKKNMIN
jgi:hypothetical protein